MERLAGVGLLLLVGALLHVFLDKRVSSSPIWRATATPLASIIGSGFLVVAPLLAITVGAYAPFAMVAIVVVAYSIGEMMRFQITHTEPLTEVGGHPVLLALERASGASLALAYVVSVAFYLRLLSSFALSFLHLQHPEFSERVLTTIVISFIALWGATKGLRSLEALEDLAVAVKLSIIGALLVALAVFDVSGAVQGTLQLPSTTIEDPVKAMRVLAGLLLVVQGFETSRYLGEEYTAPMRVKTMRYAQLSTAVIYVVFVSLCLPLMVDLKGTPDETAIITMTHVVHQLLPLLLVVAALMSQFSAAVADTIGGGGLMAQLSSNRIPNRAGYVILLGAATALVWFADIFQAIAVASRAFALYYLIQTLSASYVAYELKKMKSVAQLLGLALLLVAVVVFAIPAG